MHLTSKQQARFWRVFARAWATAKLDDPTLDQTAYRRQLIATATGHTSLKTVDRGKGYDALMLATATAAEDWDEAAHFCVAGERRMRAVAADGLRQLAEIDGETHLQTSIMRWHYYGSIMLQAYAVTAWEDLSEEQLWRVNCMVDTHRRRRLKDHGWRGAHYNEPLAYVPGARWTWDNGYLRMTSPSESKRRVA